MLNRSAAILLLAVIILFASCISEDESNTVKDAVGDSTNIPATTIEAWQGNLNGNIPVLIWYTKTKGILHGSLFYTNQKDATPITIIGEEQDGSYFLDEFLQDGTVTGFWHLNPQISSAEGQWSAPETDKQYSASLMHIDTNVKTMSIYNIGDVSGSYNYSYGEDGGSGSLGVIKIDTNKVVISFSNVTGAPAHNLAELDNDTLEIVNNIATHNDTEFGNCSFQISFYNGFAIVEYIDGKTDCGFGHRATINGIYLKTH